MMDSLNIFNWGYGLKFGSKNKWGVSEHIYEACEKALYQADFDEDGHPGLALVAFVYEDGSYEFGTDTACHAQLNEASEHGYRVAPLKYIQNFWNNDSQFSREADEEVQLRYINWLVNESPYAEVFVIKDPTEIIGKYYLIDASAPANLVVGACVCARFSWEAKNESAINIWYKIVELGGNPNLAFAFAHVYRGGNSQDKLYPITCTPGYDSHNVVSFSNASFEKVSNFITNTQRNLEDPFNRVLEYNRVESVWETRPNLDWNHDHSEEFKDFLLSLEPISGVKEFNYNIFKPKNLYDRTKETYKITNDEDLMSVFKQVEEKLYEYE
jgi:hypothetical protein